MTSSSLAGPAYKTFAILLLQKSLRTKEKAAKDEAEKEEPAKDEAEKEEPAKDEAEKEEPAKDKPKRKSLRTKPKRKSLPRTKPKRKNLLGFIICRIKSISNGEKTLGTVSDGFTASGTSSC